MIEVSLASKTATIINLVPDDISLSHCPCRRHLNIAYIAEDVIQCDRTDVCLVLPRFIM